MHLSSPSRPLRAPAWTTRPRIAVTFVTVRDGRYDRCGMEPLEVLAHSELFEGSSPSDFASLQSSIRTCRYGRGEFVWRAGDSADRLYVILSGEVVASRLNAQGAEFVAEAFIAGDAMGSLHLFEETPIRILDARASMPTSCLVVPGASMRQLLMSRPALMVSMLRTYSRWIRQRDLLDADTAFQSLTGRVVAKLLELSGRFGEATGDETAIRLQLTETTLANMLGASRENVSRAVARLARSGDVRRENSYVVIRNREGLRARYSSIARDEARSNFGRGLEATTER